MTTLLQGADFKTLAQLIALGGNASELLNDTQIYLTALGLNVQLSAAIANGSLVIAYTPGTQGSVPASGLPGVTSGAAIPAGVVGEKITATWSTVTGLATGAGVAVTSLSLTAGKWLLFGGVICIPATSGQLNYIATAINTTSASFGGTFLNQNALNNTVGINGYFSQVTAWEELTTTTTFFLNASCNTISGTWGYNTPSGNGGYFFAIRYA
jgi:hypothetical protein